MTELQLSVCQYAWIAGVMEWMLCGTGESCGFKDEGADQAGEPGPCAETDALLHQRPGPPHRPLHDLATRGWPHPLCARHRMLGMRIHDLATSGWPHPLYARQRMLGMRIREAILVKFELKLIHGFVSASVRAGEFIFCGIAVRLMQILSVGDRACMLRIV